MSKETQSKSNRNREEKRAQFSNPAQKKSSWKIIAAAVMMAAIGLVSYLAMGGSGDKPASTPVTIANQTAGASSDLRISLSEIAGGKAKFFDYKTSDNRSLNFFALKSSDGVYRAALDACDTCFHAKKGYHQEGDEMVCNNCGLRFPSARINEVSGGCNPVGLATTIEGDQLVIKTSDLEKGKTYF